jgi:hypothetical protein
MKGFWEVINLSNIKLNIQLKISSITASAEAFYSSAISSINNINEAFWELYSDTSSSVGEAKNTTLTTINSYLPKDYDVKSQLFSAVAQSWDAVTRVSDLGVLTKIANDEKTKNILIELSKANLLYYLAPAMIEKAIVNFMFAANEKYWISYSLARFTDTYSLAPIRLKRIYDNMVLNYIFTQILAQDQLNQHKKNCKPDIACGHYQACECGFGAKLSAGMYSAINYFAASLLIDNVAYYVPGMGSLTPLFNAFILGSSLAELPYAGVGMCSAHRAENLSKQNVYSLTLGGLFLGAGELLEQGFYHYLGLKSSYIRKAIDAALYPYFAASLLLGSKPLSCQKQGIDFLYYHRYLFEHFTNNQISKLKVYALNQEKIKTRKQDKLVEDPGLLQRINDYKLGRMMVWRLSRDFYGHWKSWDDFKINPANILFFDQYYETAIAELKNLKENRKPLSERKPIEIPKAFVLTLIVEAIRVLPDWATSPVIMEEQKKILLFLFGKTLELPLDNTINFLAGIRKVQLTHATVSIFNKKKWQQAQEQGGLNLNAQPAAVVVRDAQVGDTAQVVVDTEVGVSAEAVVNTEARVRTGVVVNGQRSIAAGLPLQDLPALKASNGFFMTGLAVKNQNFKSLLESGWVRVFEKEILIEDDKSVSQEINEKLHGELSGEIQKEIAERQNEIQDVKQKEEHENKLGKGIEKSRETNQEVNHNENLEKNLTKNQEGSRNDNATLLPDGLKINSIFYQAGQQASRPRVRRTLTSFVENEYISNQCAKK